MHDIKYIRENPAAFDQAMARRGVEAQSPAILALDEKLRGVQTELQVLQQERNEKSKEIGVLKSKGEDAQGIMDEVSALKDKLAEMEGQERDLSTHMKDIISALPNRLDEAVPDGADEDDNVVIRTWGDVKENPDAPEHWEIGETLGLMDFEQAAKMSGSRFVILKGGLARLERALAHFMLDTQTLEHGYTEVSPPLLVNDDAMYWSDKLPKFDNGYRLDEGMWLIPTSEVPLACMVAEKIIDPDTLPHRMTSFTSCFRSEAGSAGKDTRGMLRQHQFYKVEMVSITHPDKSDEEHERMLGCAQAILEKLELPYRTVTLCSGDTGFGAKKTYDIEVWLPGQNAYREISSCSNCGDFQARRMNARFKEKGEKRTQFLHTLNGSGLAVGRTLIAVMENYYDPTDGGVFIPKALKPFMGGLEKIAR